MKTIKQKTTKVASKLQPTPRTTRKFKTAHTSIKTKILKCLFKGSGNLFINQHLRVWNKRKRSKSINKPIDVALKVQGGFLMRENLYLGLTKLIFILNKGV